MMGEGLPRTYRVHWGWQAFFVVGAAVCFGIGLTLAATSLGVVGSEPPKVSKAEELAIGALVMVGGVLSLGLARHRITLSQDGVQALYPWKSTTLGLDDIAGIRRMKGSVRLMDPQGHARISISEIVGKDQVLNDWLGQFPDLDAMEQNAAVNAALNRLPPGASAIERQNALDEARRTAKGINLASIIILLWGLLYPRPFPAVVCLLAILPIVALTVVVRGRGLYAIADWHPRGLPNISLPFTSGLVLALRALVDFRFVNDASLMWTTLGIAIAITTAIIVSVKPVRRLVTVVAVLLISAAYAYGLLAAFNCLADTSAATAFQAEVLSKERSAGKGSHYRLKLAPWGPVSAEEWSQVGFPLFNAVEPHDKVVLSVKTGALGWGWFSIRAEPSSATPRGR